MSRQPASTFYAMGRFCKESHWLGSFLLRPASDARVSAFLILLGDFVLNDAFVVGLFAMMEERVRDELRRVSVTDQLTGSINRAGMMAKVREVDFRRGRALLLQPDA